MPQATLHGMFPDSRNERPFAKRILDLDFPFGQAPHLWFVQILGVRDVDAIILVPNLGLFVIELKSYPLSCILEVSHSGWRLDPSVKHSTKSPPWKQAQYACNSLKGQMERSTYWKQLRRPWLSAGGALYRISRAAFKNRFGTEATQIEKEWLDRLCEGLLFAEDIENGPTFIARLRRLKFEPLLRRAPRTGETWKYNKEMISALDAYLRWKVQPSQRASAYDYRRLEIIEKKEEKRLDRVDLSYPVVCTGYAGTGKTVLGLQAALRRSVSTLFLCYNKVLATDIRRLADLSPRLRQFPFDSQDVYDLLAECEKRLELERVPRDDQDFDSWAQMRVEHLREANEKRGRILGKTWEFIVVDEAQDLPDWAWDLIFRLVGPNASLFVIDGKRQSLYRDTPADYLSMLRDVMPDKNYVKKRRVFRTPDATFLLSQLFMMSYPDPRQAERIWQKQLGPAYRKALAKEASKQNSNLGFELPRKGGYPPKLINLWTRNSTTSIMGPTERGIQVVSDLLVTGYQKVTKNYNGKAGDILILVPYYGEKRRSRTLPSQLATGGTRRLR
jgi:hypothetical protein